jgi:hypothetical protein
MEKFKVIIDSEGIIHLDEQAEPTEESTAAMRDEVIELAKKSPEPSRIIINLMGIKNAKFFATEEETLSWLKNGGSFQQIKKQK